MIIYYKLLDILNRRSMTKEELRQQIGISSATMTKISAHKTVSLKVIDKICCALNCQPGDIIEYTPVTLLTGSVGTGKNIMQNLEHFTFMYKGSQPAENGTIHQFNWVFGIQAGNIGIKVQTDGTIDASSLINCTKNIHEFSRPLGAYNDDTLYTLFQMMLFDRNISCK